MHVHLKDTVLFCHVVLLINAADQLTRLPRQTVLHGAAVYVGCNPPLLQRRLRRSRRMRRSTGSAPSSWETRCACLPHLVLLTAAPIGLWGPGFQLIPEAASSAALAVYTACQQHYCCISSFNHCRRAAPGAARWSAVWARCAALCLLSMLRLLCCAVLCRAAPHCVSAWRDDGTLSGA